MTTGEAVRVAKIMANRQLKPSTMIVELLSEFEGEVDWVEFFNELDDSIDTATHDRILGDLEMRREGRA